MIIVLGFDGLGLELIEEFKLKAIKQKAYTETDLSDFKTEPFTPIIWASMLTGRKIDAMENKYMEYKIDTNKPHLNLLKRIIPLGIRRRFLSNLYAKIVWRSRGLKRLPMEELDHYLLEHNIPCIFDILKENGISYWHNNIPGYNGFPKFRELHDRIKDIKHDAPGSLERYYRFVWSNHLTSCREFFEALKRNLDFYFFYTTLVDNIGHWFYGSKQERFKLAHEVNRIVARIHDEYPNATVYVISDHGMKQVNGYGDHSEKGFFSSNTGELIRKPMDLYHLILKNILGDRK